jgi:hypothetical protein
MMTSSSGSPSGWSASPASWATWSIRIWGEISDGALRLALPDHGPPSKRDAVGPEVEALRIDDLRDAIVRAIRPPIRVAIGKLRFRDLLRRTLRGSTPRRPPRSGSGYVRHQRSRILSGARYRSPGLNNRARVRLTTGQALSDGWNEGSHVFGDGPGSNIGRRLKRPQIARAHMTVWASQSKDTSRLWFPASN